MPQNSVRTFTYIHEGLRLAGRRHGSLDGGRLPFVCLPGLTRNSRDFDAFVRIPTDVAHDSEMKSPTVPN